MQRGGFDTWMIGDGGRLNDPGFLIGGFPFGVAFSVTADDDSDGSYNTDLSARLLGFSFERGHTATSDVARAGLLTLRLNNSDNAITLTGGAFLQLTTTFAETDQPIFTGRVVSVEETPGDHGVPELLVRVADRMRDLSGRTVELPLVRDKSTGAALHHLFDYLDFTDKPEAVSFVMDIAALDQTTRLGGSTALRDFDDGQSDIAYVGDLFGAAVDARDHVQQISAVESGGLFYVNGAGQFVFRHRYHNITQGETAPEITPVNLTDARLSVGDSVANRLTVRYRPRWIGEPRSTIYDHLPAPIPVKPNQSRTVYATYRATDRDDLTIAAFDVVYPSYRSGDIEVRNLPEFGDSREIPFTFSFTANTAELTFTNNLANETVYIRRVRLRGTPVFHEGDGSVTVNAPESVAAHGVRTAARRVSLLSSSQEAENFARLMLQGVSQPMAAPETITVEIGGYGERDRSDNRMARQIWAANYDIGDVIRLTDTATAHDGLHKIVGVERRFDVLTERHTLTWRLRPLNRTKVAVLDSATFGALDDFVMG